MQFETQEFDWSGRRRFRRLNLDSPLWWTNDPSSPSSTSFVGGCCVKTQSPSAIEPTRCTVAAESTLVFSMDWAQVSTRMQRSRKPALCTFRALPSIHTQRTQTRSANTHPCICHPPPDIRCASHAPAQLALQVYSTRMPANRAFVRFHGNAPRKTNIWTMLAATCLPHPFFWL